MVANAHPASNERKYSVARIGRELFELWQNTGKIRKEANDWVYGKNIIVVADESLPGHAMVTD